MSAPRLLRNILISQAIMVLVPGILAIFWPLFAYNRDLAIALLRPVCLGAALALAMLWSGKPFTRAEWQLAGILAILVTAMLVPSRLATDPARAMKEWVKLILMAVYCLAFARALRNPACARFYAIGLVAAACVMGVLLMGTYVDHMGFTMPTYEALRRYKGMAVNAGVMVNPTAFSCIFCYICAMCILRANKALWCIGLVLLLVCTFFTGTRMPPVVAGATCLSMAVIAGLRSRILPVKVITWTGIVCAAGALAVVLFAFSEERVFRTMSTVSEGRWDIWSVALTKFTERPVFGYGYVSWRDDLVSRLPGDYQWTRDIAEMVAGGYHNEFMTVLAEQGIVGTAAVAALFGFMLRSGWRLAFEPWLTWKNGRWALFAALFLVLRANVEVPGLFGYAQEPADFIAYGFLAGLVASMSAEEDHLRLMFGPTNRPPHGRGFAARALESPVRYAYPSRNSL